ncbi:hypothetical protein P606_11940 [Comamonas thiooxydans]|nr:hypothetical protein P606_11940 [Comamonas thiooxydans]
MAASLAANVVQLALQGHGIEALEGQRQEQFDAPAQRDGVISLSVQNTRLGISGKP